MMALEMKLQEIRAEKREEADRPRESGGGPASGGERTKRDISRGQRERKKEFLGSCKGHINTKNGAATENTSEKNEAKLYD